MNAIKFVAPTYAKDCKRGMLILYDGGSIKISYADPNGVVGRDTKTYEVHFLPPFTPITVVSDAG